SQILDLVPAFTVAKLLHVKTSNLLARLRGNRQQAKAWGFQVISKKFQMISRTQVAPLLEREQRLITARQATAALRDHGIPIDVDGYRKWVTRPGTMAGRKTAVAVFDRTRSIADRRLRIDLRHFAGLVDIFQTTQKTWWTVDAIAREIAR